MRAFYSAYFALAATACAQTWTGALNGNWNDPGNWNGGVPVSGTTTDVLFDQPLQPDTVQNISGGLTLNSLTFGAASGVRVLSGNPLAFDGTEPRLRMLNSAGTGNSIIGLPLVLNQTLEIEGGPDFDHQLLLNSSAVISGPGGVRIKGGVTAFNAPNTYSGQTVVESGGLGVNRSNSFGSSPSVSVQAGGWIQLIGGGSLFINKPLTIAGEGTLVPAVSYALSANFGSTKEWAGSVTLAGDASMLSFGGTLLSLSGSEGLHLGGHRLTLRTGLAAGDTISVTKVIQGSGNLLVQAQAASAGVVLNAQNTFSGGILLLSGRCTIHSNAALGAAPNTVTLNGGTLRAFDGLTIPATRPIVISTGGGTFRGGDGSSSSQTLVLQSVLTGPNPINIQQRVTLAGTNSFSGVLTVQPGGTLNTTTDSNLGDVASEIRLEGGADAPAAIRLPPDFNTARVITLPGVRGFIETTAPVTFTRPFTGSGELAISSHAGTVTLPTVNTHTGGTRLESGTTVIDADSALGPADKPLTLAGQSVLAASRDLTIPATRPITVSGGGFDTTGVKIHVQGNLNGPDNGYVDVGGTGVFHFDGVLSGSLYLEESTFSGICSVQEYASVSDGAVLSPGTETTKGSITVKDIRMDGATLKVRVGGGASDKLVVTDSIYNMTATLEVSTSGAVAPGETFTVLEKVGASPHNSSFYSSTGAYFGNGESFTAGGVIWTISYEGGDGNDVTITALNGNAVPLTPPSFADLVFSPPSTPDPESIDSYPKISGKVVSGVPGSTVYLESSTDLGLTQDWTQLEAFTLDNAGAAVFADRYSFDASGAPRNFYRLRVP